jgi:hypothetical protein
MQQLLHFLCFNIPWAWRWSFSWRFRRCSASAFRSCVARHLCLQKFFLDHPQNICFFGGDVIIHLRLGLEINKTNTKTKRKLWSSKTLDWFFFVLRMIKFKRCKRKIKRKNWKYSQTQTKLNLDYLFPSNSARKRGLLMVDCCIKVRLDLQADKSTIIVKGPLFP